MLIPGFATWGMDGRPFFCGDLRNSSDSKISRWVWSKYVPLQNARGTWMVFLVRHGDRICEHPMHKCTDRWQVERSKLCMQKEQGHSNEGQLA